MPAVLTKQLRTFAAIGLLSTLGYAACYSALRLGLPASIANAVSLLLMTLANTAANRRFTFKGAGRRSALRDHAWGLAALTVALCLTTISMGGLRLLAPRAGLPDELAVLTAANLVATAVRFAALRTSASFSSAADGGSSPVYDLASTA
jgi:putative flippase GtrA